MLIWLWYHTDHTDHVHREPLWFVCTDHDLYDNYDNMIYDNCILTITGSWVIIHDCFNDDTCAALEYKRLAWAAVGRDEELVEDIQ